MALSSVTHDITEFQVLIYLNKALYVPEKGTGQPQKQKVNESKNK